jgi:type VII secretion integral membrane protein EccD
VAIASLIAGAVVARSYNAVGTGVLVAAAGGLPMAYVAGLYIVPGAIGRPSLLLASVLVLIFASASILLIGRGITVFIAAATAGALSGIAFLIGIFVDHPVQGIAAGTAAVSLAALSVLPRLTIQLAKLPLPTVPGSAEDLKEDTGFPEYSVIERRTANAHEYLTGMIIGCGGVAALFAVIAAGDGSIWGPLLAIVVTLVLLLRGRAYANGAQAVALLASGMVAGTGVLFGWLVQSTPGDRLLYVFGTLVVVGAGALVLGVIFPNQKFSPVLRRTVDVLEAILIAAVLPLALAVMDLYVAMRQLIPA